MSADNVYQQCKSSCTTEIGDTYLFQSFTYLKK